MTGKNGAVRLRHCACQAAVLMLLLTVFGGGSAHAVDDVTPNITVTNGINSDQTAASWKTWGALTYSATQPPGQGTVVYDWSSQSSADQWFLGLTDYKDATIYHRRVIVYDPGTAQSIVWASCPETSMDTYTLPSAGWWYFKGATPSPTSSSSLL
jgi:hypothetical protein